MSSKIYCSSEVLSIYFERIIHGIACAGSASTYFVPTIPSWVPLHVFDCRADLIDVRVNAAADFAGLRSFQHLVVYVCLFVYV